MDFNSLLSTFGTTKSGPEMKDAMYLLINVHANMISEMTSRLHKLQERIDQNG